MNYTFKSNGGVRRNMRDQPQSSNCGLAAATELRRTGRRKEAGESRENRGSTRRKSISSSITPTTTTRNRGGGCDRELSLRQPEGHRTSRGKRKIEIN